MIFLLSDEACLNIHKAMPIEIRVNIQCIHQKPKMMGCSPQSIHILVPLVENIDLDYIRFTVEPILRSKIKGRMGHDGQNEFTKLPGGTIERVKISIPIKEDGSFDLEAQQEIANKYRKIQQINSSICQQIDELINIKIAL